jgi:tRNA(adenine34) deaminase
METKSERRVRAVEHTDYMARALELAAQAAEQGDVPVGCVIVREGRIVGEGRNRREERGDATAHAELEAIRDACGRLGSWRLEGCTLYVTLEPCPMCAGGIINARIAQVRYGTRDEKAGACGSVLNLFEERFNHKPRLYRGPLEAECAAVLGDFFQTLRER